MILLDHQYSKANISAGALKGTDAHALAFLAPVADELGFQLHLAILEHEAIAVVENYSMPFEPYERSTKLQSIVDLSGKPLDQSDDESLGDSELHESLGDAELHAEFIPLDYAKRMEGSEEVREECDEPYTGNVSAVDIFLIDAKMFIDYSSYRMVAM